MDLKLKEEISQAMQESKQEKKRLNCDQVSWVMNILERLLTTSQHRFPAVSRMPEAAKFAALLEIMEVLGYEFEDNAAAGNALAPFWEFNAMRRAGE